MAAARDSRDGHCRQRCSDWRNSVYLDVVLGTLDRQGVRQSHQAELGHSVIRMAESCRTCHGLKLLRLWDRILGLFVGCFDDVRGACFVGYVIVVRQATHRLDLSDHPVGHGETGTDRTFGSPREFVVFSGSGFQHHDRNFARSQPAILFKGGRHLVEASPKFLTLRALRYSGLHLRSVAAEGNHCVTIGCKVEVPLRVVRLATEGRDEYEATTVDDWGAHHSLMGPSTFASRGRQEDDWHPAQCPTEATLR
jgi:hypothetical protein